MKTKVKLAAMAAGLMLVAGGALAQPYGMGPGMMGGYGGYGGPGAYGMGPGMMGGYGGNAYPGLDLAADQRKEIDQIQQETSKAMWPLMQKMHELGYQMYGTPGQGPADVDAARKAYQAMADTQKAMFDQQLEARKRIDAVLTKEQHEQLQRYWGGRR
jgi:Spy/CpxP family protein refolding chaperone